MKYSERHHYLVRTHYSQLTRGLKCFEASTAAIAYMVGKPGVSFSVECLTHAACPSCHPDLRIIAS